MRSLLRSRRNVRIVIATVAVLLFLQIHNYARQAGLFSAVMDGEIWITGACRYYSEKWPTCGLGFPYRWIFGLAIIVFAGTFLALPEVEWRLAAERLLRLVAWGVIGLFALLALGIVVAFFYAATHPDVLR
jgi:hypothetical protein